MSIPVRVYPVSAGAGVDDPNRRTLVTCRRESDAQRVVHLLEDLKRAGAFAPDDQATQFFQTPLDTELVLDVTSLADAIAQGYTVRSVVLPTAAVPTDSVIGTLAGGIADPSPDPATTTSTTGGTSP